MLKFLGKAFLIIALIAATVYGWIYFTIKADVEELASNKNTAVDEIIEEPEKEVAESEDSDEEIDISNVKVVDKEEISDKLNVVPTLVDTLTTNSAWCGTMQLIWNDMIDEVLGTKPVFEESLLIAENLNKQTFTERDLSEKYYYKKYGIKNLDLKAEIEKGIKDKFGETSDVLDKIDWSASALDPETAGVDRYLFYAMLKREFQFPIEFDVLDKGKFGTQDNVNYFGIETSTSKSVDKQLNVLYYENEDDFALEIETKDSDKIVLVRKDKFETNFKDIYNVVKARANSYEGNKEFDTIDTFKMPNLEFDVLRNYNELVGKTFKTPDGMGEINAAMQTIKLKLDNKGGEIKSEAVMDVTFTSSIILEPENKEPRHFNCDEEFVMFLVEDGKENPYFAVKVDDITLFQ